MITLEEAIAHEKAKADKARESEALFLHDDLMWNAKESHRRLEEHEQYAAWLEELGRRRVEELFRKTDEKSIRDKAIDDFVNACKNDILCQTFGLRQCDIEKIAERLKESDISAKQFEG